MRVELPIEIWRPFPLGGSQRATSKWRDWLATSANHITTRCTYFSIEFYSGRSREYDGANQQVALFFIGRKGRPIR